MSLGLVLLCYLENVIAYVMADMYLLEYQVIVTDSAVMLFLIVKFSYVEWYSFFPSRYWLRIEGNGR